MKIRSLVLVLFLLGVMLIVASCTSSSSNATPAATSNLDGATLVQERCSVCHPASIVSSRSHTQAQWKAIVGQMIQRGAQLTPDEETRVVDFLAANYGK